MSFEKRFKILPARTGYKKILISSYRSFKRNNTCTNQNNIFKAHLKVFRDFPDDTVDKNLLANAGDITNSTFENKR